MIKDKVSKSTLKKYKLIVDEWFVNGFNGTKAYKKFYKRIKDETAAVNFAKIKEIRAVSEYIDSKYKDSSGKSHLEHDDILRELEAFAMLDVTSVLNIKTVEIKGVRRVVDEKAMKEAKKKNPERKRKIYKEENYTYSEQKFIITDFDKLTEVQRRSIKSVKEGKFGLEVEFYDKMRAFDMLNKHKGFYEKDNSQKAAVIDYGSLPSEILLQIWAARKKT